VTARSQKSYAALTDIGQARPHNEDSILTYPPLYVVADGLGGHDAGEVASSIAVATIRDHAPGHADAPALARAVRAANRAIIRATAEGIGRSGMGTTITAVIVGDGRAVLAQVGDSRAYLLHNSELMRITEDHSMVADLIRSGQLTEAESRVHPNRSVITRALGTEADLEVDTYEIGLEDGNRLLLCSDGLTSMLVDEEIAGILRGSEDPEETAQSLVWAANDAGGTDNISVVVIDIGREEQLGRRQSGRGGRAHGCTGRHTDGHGRTDAGRDERTGGPAGAGATGRGRRWLAVLGWTLALALAVSGAGGLAYSHARRSVFVAEDQGVVVVYRGVPGEFAGHSLKWELKRTQTPVASLPPSIQRQLADGVRVSNAEEAFGLAKKYQDMVGPESEVPLSGSSPGSLPYGSSVGESYDSKGSLPYDSPTGSAKPGQGE